MPSSFAGLLFRLLLSIALVYMLIVVNSQCWLDPFIIISALPAAFSGIVWFLCLTKTDISVPTLTRSIMCMGVDNANSINSGANGDAASQHLTSDSFRLRIRHREAKARHRPKLMQVRQCRLISMARAAHRLLSVFSLNEVEG